MKRLLFAACAVAALGQPAGAAEWVERYFGVGSAIESAAACGEARGDARVNSSNACTDRRGTRKDASYTECVCSRVSESIHICNVNLKVSCDGPLSSAGARVPRKQGGDPKDRANRGGVAAGGRRASTERPDPKVYERRDAPERPTWTGGLP